MARVIITRTGSSFDVLTSVYFYPRSFMNGSQRRCFSCISFMWRAIVSLFPKGSLIILSGAKGHRGLTRRAACYEGKVTEKVSKPVNSTPLEKGYRYAKK